MDQKLFHKMYLTCEEATMFIEKKLGNSLTTEQREKLKVHLTNCPDCNNYAIKASKIDNHLSEIENELLLNRNLNFEDLKNSIKNKILDHK